MANPKRQEDAKLNRLHEDSVTNFGWRGSQFELAPISCLRSLSVKEQTAHQFFQRIPKMTDRHQKKLSSENVSVQVVVAELALGVESVTQLNKVGHFPVTALEIRR